MGVAVTLPELSEWTLQVEYGRKTSCPAWIDQPSSANRAFHAV